MCVCVCEDFAHYSKHKNETTNNRTKHLHGVYFYGRNKNSQSFAKLFFVFVFEFSFNSFFFFFLINKLSTLLFTVYSAIQLIPVSMLGLGNEKKEKKVVAHSVA